MEQQTTHDGCVRWLGVLAILWAFAQLAAAVNALRTPAALAVVVSPLSPIIGILALTWAVSFGVAGVLLLLKHRHALQWTAWLMVVFLLVNTSRTVALAQADYERGRLPFLIITATLLAIIPLIYLINRVMRGDKSDGEI